MEQNLPIIAKKIWKMAQVIYFMLRKGISKGKVLSALNMMMKRSKIAGKEAVQSLVVHYHHHHHHAASAAGSTHGIFHLPFHLHKRRNSGAHPQPLSEEDLTDALDMFTSAAASPVLPGFVPSPIVKQLRITDSPFPLRDVDQNNHVDEAAEEFIMKFYKNLKQQNSVDYLSYS
ncbi:hypothetical protein OROHE_005828 [Orobanche hederae]